MSLRARLVAALLLAAVVPLVVGALVWSRRLEPTVERLAEDKLDRVRTALGRERDRLAESARLGVVSAVEGFLGDDVALAALLAGRFADAESALDAVRLSSGLDGLLVVDGQTGRVMADAAKNERGLPAGEFVEAEPGGPFWLVEPGRLRVAAVFAERRPDGRRMLLAGWRDVAAAELDLAARAAGAREGTVVAHQGGGGGPDRENEVYLPLPGADARAVGRWRAEVDLDEETALALSLRRDTLVVLILAAVVSSLLGVWIAGRVARPVDRLTRAMEGVASGDWDLSLPAARAELGRLSEAFNRMTEALATSRREGLAAERRAAWREAARRVAHEVKNPLSPIRTAVENLRRARSQGADVLEGVFALETATVLEEVDRLRRLVDEFSRFARMPHPRMAPTDIGPLAMSAARRQVPDSSPVRLELSVAEGLPPVACDADQVAGVVSNLVANGVQALGESGGRLGVAVRGSDDGGAVEVEVRDDGPGIPEEDRDLIFTPYFSTRRGRGGKGLGLAIAAEVAREHGGSLSLESADGAGTAFLLSLPVERPEGSGESREET